MTRSLQREKLTLLLVLWVEEVVSIREVLEEELDVVDPVVDPVVDSVDTQALLPLPEVPSLSLDPDPEILTP